MTATPKRLTGKAWKDALADLRSVAYRLDRACESHQSREFSELRDIIKAQEKRHRQFAPAGHRHRFPIEAAVNYFIVQTFADAWRHAADETVSDIADLRDDYVQARFIVARMRKRCPERLTSELVTDVLRCAEAHDYTQLVGDS